MIIQHRAQLGVPYRSQLGVLGSGGLPSMFLSRGLVLSPALRNNEIYWAPTKRLYSFEAPVYYTGFVDGIHSDWTIQTHNMRIANRSPQIVVQDGVVYALQHAQGSTGEPPASVHRYRIVKYTITDGELVETPVSNWIEDARNLTYLNGYLYVSGKDGTNKRDVTDFSDWVNSYKTDLSFALAGPSLQHRDAPAGTMPCINIFKVSVEGGDFEEAITSIRGCNSWFKWSEDNYTWNGDWNTIEVPQELDNFSYVPQTYYDYVWVHNYKLHFYGNIHGTNLAAGGQWPLEPHTLEGTHPELGGWNIPLISAFAGKNIMSPVWDGPHAPMAFYSPDGFVYRLATHWELDDGLMQPTQAVNYGEGHDWRTTYIHGSDLESPVVTAYQNAYIKTTRKYPYRGYYTEYTGEETGVGNNGTTPWAPPVFADWPTQPDYGTHVGNRKGTSDNFSSEPIYYIAQALYVEYNYDEYVYDEFIGMYYAIFTPTRILWSVFDSVAGTPIGLKPSAYDGFEKNDKYFMTAHKVVDEEYTYENKIVSFSFSETPTTTTVNGKFAGGEMFDFPIVSPNIRVYNDIDSPGHIYEM